MKVKQDQFLNITVNKQTFINILHDAYFRGQIASYLMPKVILIVKTAAESAKTVDTIRIGDNTDLQILLC